jgi:hypothetical protein
MPRFPPIPPPVTPIGFFVPSPPALVAPSPLLADAIDINTGEYTDLFAGEDPIDAQVKIACKTTLASGSAVSDIGQELNKIRKLDDGAPLEIEAVLRAALATLIGRGDIQLLGVDVETGGQEGDSLVRYVNMRSPDRRVRTARISQPEFSS